MDLNVAIVLFGAIVVLYTMIGGLWAVLMTDVLQFIVLTVVVFLTAILMIMGSAGDYADRVPDTFFSLTAGSYGWFFLLGWVIIHFFMIGAEWAFVQRFIAVRSPRDARKSAYLFGTLYLITPLFWLLPPLVVPGTGRRNRQGEGVHPRGAVGAPARCSGAHDCGAVFRHSQHGQLSVERVCRRPDQRFLSGHLSTLKPANDPWFKWDAVFTALLGGLLVVMAIMVPKMGGAEKLIVSINSLLVVPLFAPTLWGLFSRKIGLRDMLIVALTSFGIGLTLRFGIASNPMITEGQALFVVAEYLSQNTKNVEVLVGVILPVLMLIGFEWFRRGTDSGALRVEQHCQESTAEDLEDSVPSQFDPFPARMVMFSLYLMGLWMIVLGSLQASDRLVILVFGTLLLGLGGLIQLVMKQLLRRSRTSN